MNAIIKTAVGFVLAAAIAAGGYFTGELTRDQAIAIVKDSEVAADQCQTLLEGKGFYVVNPEAVDPEGEEFFAPEE